MAQLIPLPITVFCSRKSGLVLVNSLVPAHPGSPRKKSRGP